MQNLCCQDIVVYLKLPPGKRKNPDNRKHTIALYNPRPTYYNCTYQGLNLWAKKQNPDHPRPEASITDLGWSRYRCVPKIASRETIKPKDTTAHTKLPGNPGGNGPPDVGIPSLQSPLCSQRGVWEPTKQACGNKSIFWKVSLCT